MQERQSESSNEAMESEQETTTVTESAASRIFIFDIYVIHAEICKHLTTRSIRRCTRVSRAFHASFQPYLWRDIRISCRTTLNKFQQLEHQAALTRNARYVQSIMTVFADAWPWIYTKNEIPEVVDGGDEISTIDGTKESHEATTTFISPPKLKTNGRLRTFPNLRAIHSSSIKGRRSSNLSTNIRKTPLIFPMLDPRVVPKLWSLNIGHFTFYYKNATVELMARIRHLKTIKELRIMPYAAETSCEFFRRIMESVPHVEALTLDLTVKHSAATSTVCEQELRTWIQGRDAEGSANSRMISGTSIQSTGEQTTDSATELESSTTTEWVPSFKLPDRFAVKTFKVQISYCNEVSSVMEVLERSPDIETLKIPGFLLAPSYYSRLVGLLPKLTRLKKLIITRLSVQELELTEVIRSASQCYRNRSDDPISNSRQRGVQSVARRSLDVAFQEFSLDQTPNTTTPSHAKSIYDGRGLESLFISKGRLSSPMVSQAILDFHSMTLVTVTLAGCRMVDRKNLHRLLCSCPNLEVLDAMSSSTSRPSSRDAILVTDEILPSTNEPSSPKEEESEELECRWGWICSRLRVLKLRFFTRDSTMDWIPHDFEEQVRKMQYLEDLRLGRMTDVDFLKRSERETTPTASPTTSSVSSPVTASPTTPTSEGTEGSHDSTTLVATEPKEQQDPTENHGVNELEMRTLGVTLALDRLIHNLSRLKTLEMRGLKGYMNERDIERAKESWRELNPMLHI
ncbi:hypothetical protein B0O80DRAFT_445650 [Mortierella sp. GBAus27b]|nr:hypothetical protein BGX31_004769 [Mortierella sp. GBA43]KAI8357708.1 hypothetical protein B0O80DRAFT_445650 [Mortierella sp. GBAus27b]